MRDNYLPSMRPQPDAADGKEVTVQTRDWEIAVGQAETLAKLAGKVPAGLDRALA
jgi:hypothetical protein